MRVPSLLAAVGLVLMTGVAAAQTSIPPVLPANQTPGDKPGQTAANDNTEVCIYEKMTGTLFMQRVCRTERAWKLMREASHEFMEYGFRGSHQAGESSGG